MTSVFNDSTMQGLEYALNSLGTRQEVIANNIANAQTPNYVSQDVSFESQLASIFAGDSAAAPTDTGTVVQAPDVPAGQNGNSVGMEAQMSKMSETNLLYSALTQLTVDRMGILKTAITGQ